MVTADRVKPAHIERTPENEQTRQSTAMSKTTAKRPTAKIHEPQTAVVGKRSTTTSTPSEAGVCTKQNLSRQSTIKTKATAPGVNPRGEKRRRFFTRRRMSGTPRLLSLTGGTR